MRRRILALVAAVTSVVLIALLLPACYLVSRVAENTAVTRAQTQVQALIPVVALSSPATVALAVDQVRQQGYQVWVSYPGGATVGVDPTGGRTGELGTSQALITDIDTETAGADGRLIAQPVGGASGVTVIRLLLTDPQLRSGVVTVWAILGGIGLVLLAGALLVSARLAGNIARPVTTLATTAEQLGSGDLAARVTPDGPGEVREVGLALNHLAERISVLLAAERERVGDLSHRLRTPLTALRLDAGALADPTERDRITDGVDAVDDAVTDAIATARRAAADPHQQRCDAIAVVRQRMAFWSILAVEQRRAVAVDLPDGSAPVAVPPDELAAALDALLGNVFAHTPEGTPVAVSVAAPAAGHDRVELRVHDEGPGLTGPQLLERGRSGGGSSGLGSDIVRRTAAASGGTATWSTGAGGGTTAVMALGAPPGH